LEVLVGGNMIRVLILLFVAPFKTGGEEIGGVGTDLAAEEV